MVLVLVREAYMRKLCYSNVRNRLTKRGITPRGRGATALPTHPWRLGVMQEVPLNVETATDEAVQHLGATQVDPTPSNHI